MVHLFVSCVQETQQPAAAVDVDAHRKQLWEKDFFAMLAEDDDKKNSLIYGMYSQYAMHLDKYYNRGDYGGGKDEWVGMGRTEAS
jgi:hypothetical protein